MIYKTEMLINLVKTATELVNKGLPNVELAVYGPECCLASGHDKAVIKKWMTAKDIVQAYDRGEL